MERGRSGPRLSAFWNDRDDPPDDACADEVTALRGLIAQTPAVGAEGARVKFELLATIADLGLEADGIIRSRRCFQNLSSGREPAIGTIWEGGPAAPIC